VTALARGASRERPMVACFFGKRLRRSTQLRALFDDGENFAVARLHERNQPTGERIEAQHLAAAAFVPWWSG
jgi:hypothetical protein